MATMMPPLCLIMIISQCSMNKKIISLALAAIAAGAMVALPARAIMNAPGTGGENKSSVEPVKQQVQNNFGFCTRISALNTLRVTRLAEWDKNLLTKRNERENKISERRQTRESKMEQTRERWDEQREKIYEKLTALADSDEQKAALERFHLVVEAAVTTRKEAVNAALNTYRAGLDEAILAKKNTLDDILSTFKNAVLAAEQQAKADCEQGIESEEARATYTEAVQAARQAMQDAREAVSKVADQGATLNEARKAAVEQALKDFKAAVEAAKIELKAVFPVKNNKATTTESGI